MGKIRDNRFDALKGFLILSVVFGHFFTHDDSHGFMSETMANFIYSFHMPLFVFISGYFSKNNRVVLGGRLLETYIVFQLIKGIAYRYSVLWLFIMPAPMLWYLVALIFWRLLYVGLDKIGIRITWHLLLVLVCLSVAAGFVPWIGREYALSRFIVFAPYFFLGAMVKEKQIIDEVKKIFSSTLCIGILLVAFAIGAVCTIYSINIRTTVFSGTIPYPAENTWLYAFARSLCYLTSFIISLAFIRVFSVENKMMGIVGKDSLKYYMFHGLFLMAVEFVGLPWSTVFAVIYATVVSIVIFLFNKTQLSNFAISPASFVVDKLKQNK